MVPDGRERPECVTRLFSRPLSGSRTVTVRSPRGPSPGVDRTRFAAAMARVRRPVPFRTRKLRPCTAMVLHPRGCGRVARRRFHTSWGPVERLLRGPFFVLHIPLVRSFFFSISSCCSPAAFPVAQSAEPKDELVECSTAVHVPFLSWIVVGGYAMRESSGRMTECV